MGEYISVSAGYCHTWGGAYKGEISIHHVANWTQLNGIKDDYFNFSLAISIYSMWN